MKCAIGLCGHCQFGPDFVCRDGPVFRYRAIERLLRVRELWRCRRPARPKVAVFKFASCDGCQLTLLDCEDELLPDRRPGRDRRLPGSVERLDRKVRSTSRSSRGRSRRPRTPSGSRGPGELPRAGHDRRLRDRRGHPGAAQLRGRRRSTTQVVYARPEYIRTLATSTPIQDHVRVDFELRGCPISKHQLLEVLYRLPRRTRPERPDRERLRRVQAARERLRAGRARHALPRPGHADGLRRDLPVVRPRMLRLLRTAGHAERPGRSRDKLVELGMDPPR